MDGDFVKNIKIIFIFLIVKANCEIPDYIHVCQRSDPELTNCIIKSIYALVPHLKAGIPELEVPPLEPLVLGNLKLNLGSGGTTIATNISDLQVWGASQFQLLSLSADIPSNTFRYDVALPQLYVEGQYQIDTHLLFLRLKGNGVVNINITNYGFNCTMPGHKIKQSDETYLEFEKMRCDIHFGKVFVHLGNLFNGNVLLGNVTNDVINENVDMFFKEIKPGLTMTIEDTFTDIANKITLKFTYEELFP